MLSKVSKRIVLSEFLINRKNGLTLLLADAAEYGVLFFITAQM